MGRDGLLPLPHVDGSSTRPNQIEAVTAAALLVAGLLLGWAATVGPEFFRSD
jgi:hypothetical protein